MATVPLTYDPATGDFVATVTTPIPVTGTITPSGTQDVNLVGTAVTQPISGTVTANAGTGTLLVDASAHAQPVTGTFFQATQPVSAVGLPLPTGAATESTLATRTKPSDTQLVDGSAHTQPVSGTFFQATQPVSGTVTANAGTGTFTVGQATGTNLHTVTDSSSVMSLGTVDSKTLVMKTGSLTTTATTVDQVVLTYTVTALKTFFIQYLEMMVAASSGHADTVFGTMSLEIVSGTKVITEHPIGPGIGQSSLYTFSEALPVSAGTVVRIVTTPAAATSFVWSANFGGFER